MTYFNPRIYNKQNLKEEDRHELEYWYDVLNNVIDNTEADYIIDSEYSVLAKIEAEIVHGHCSALKTELGLKFDDIMVSIIDSYDGDVDEVDDFETFSYTRDDDDAD